MQQDSSTKAKFKEVSHVIFDLDGTFLNTESLYAQARQNIVSKFGKKHDDSNQCQMRGLQGTEVAQKMVELLKLLITPSEFLTLIKEEYLKVMINVDFMVVSSENATCLIQQFRKVTHVIFDLDGTILNTEGIYQKVIGDIAKAYGKNYTTNIRNKVLGTQDIDTARISILEMKLPITSEEFIKQFNMNAYTTNTRMRIAPFLADTEILYTVATQNVVSQYGKNYDWSIKTQMMGLLGSEVAEKIVELLELPITPEEYTDLIQEQYKILMPTAALMPDTEGIYQQALRDVAKTYGKEYTTSVRNKVIGSVETDTAKICIAELNLPLTIEEFIKQFRQRAYTSSMEKVPFLAGAVKLVKHFHQHKIPIAVATSSSRDSYDLKTKNHQEIFSLFSHIVTGGSDPEVKRGKPNPDIFLVCAGRFPNKPEPEKCLVFEDAPNGIKAAISANMQAVMVPDPQVPAEERKLATLVLESLEQMKPELFGLPPL